MLAGLAVMVGMCSFDYQILGQYHRLIMLGHRWFWLWC